MGVLPPIAATLCVAAGITRRIACRSGASTGCSGLCPLPIPSHTFPYSPIIYRAAERQKFFIFAESVDNRFAFDIVFSDFRGNITDIVNLAQYIDFFVGNKFFAMEQYCTVRIKGEISGSEHCSRKPTTTMSKVFSLNHLSFICLIFFHVIRGVHGHPRAAWRQSHCRCCC